MFDISTACTDSAGTSSQHQVFADVNVHWRCRHGPKAATIIQPVREAGMRELALLCPYKGLPVAAPLYSPATSKASLNTLSEDFVARLQANVPSSVSTILRTACKLQV